MRGIRITDYCDPYTLFSRLNVGHTPSRKNIENLDVSGNNAKTP